jgi:hypothetical protein
MDNQPEFSTPEHLAIIREHRRQTFWQILFPIIVLIVLVFAAMLTLIATTAGAGNFTDTRYANIATIWLIMLMTVFAIIFFVILSGVVFGLFMALGALPDLAAKGEYYAALMAIMVRQVTDKITSPIISVKGGFAGGREFFHRLGRVFRP